MDLKKLFNDWSSQLGVGTRYLGTFAGGAAVAVGILGLNAINQDQINQLFAAFQQLGTALSSALTALGTIAGIASAVYAAWKSSRPQKTLDVSKIPGVQVHVDTSPKSPAPEAVKEVAQSDAPAATNVVEMGPGGPVKAGQSAKE